MDKHVINASRLRTVLNMPEYKDTIGAWLDEAKAESLKALSSSTEQVALFHAQGAYAVLTNIESQIERVFRSEQTALTRRDKRAKQNGEKK